MPSPENKAMDPSIVIPVEWWPPIRDTRHFAANVLHPALRDMVYTVAKKYQLQRGTGDISPIQVFIPRPFAEDPIFQHMLRSWGEGDKISGFVGHAFYSHGERLIIVGDGLGDMAKGKISMHSPQPLYPLSSVGRSVVVAGALDYTALWLCIKRPDLAEGQLKDLTPFYDRQYLRRVRQGELPNWSLPNATGDRINALMQTNTGGSPFEFPPLLEDIPPS